MAQEASSRLRVQRPKLVSQDETAQHPSKVWVQCVLDGNQRLSCVFGWGQLNTDTRHKTKLCGQSRSALVWVFCSTYE
jgi:hypothetical protein